MAAEGQRGADEAERLGPMTATETSSAEGRGAFLREVEAVNARRSYPAGALVPVMQPVVTEPKDPVQSILKQGDRLYLTLNEAAEMARTTKQTIINMLKDGHLRGYRFGKRHTLISLDSFMDCLRLWRPAENEMADQEEGADQSA
jgi:excisionase family DNA binding protein